MKKITKILINCHIATLLVFLPLASADAGALLENSDQVKYSSNCIKDGDCQLSDFMKVGIRVTEIILGIVGSVALLMFVYGGVMFLISGGSSERVEKGKQIIIGSVIGLVIVFASYTIIGFVFHSLGINAGTSGWASSDWFKSN